MHGYLGLLTVYVLKEWFIIVATATVAYLFIRLRPDTKHD